MKLCLRCGATFERVDWHCPGCGHEPPRIAGFPAFAPELAHGTDGYDPAFYAEFARVEAGNFWFRARNRLIVWALGRYFPEARRLLEVGCGTGYVLAGITAAFPGAVVTGSEAAADGLAFAARRVPQAALIQADARRIPFRHEFDVAAAFDVIEHIADDRGVLQALREVVRPGGGLLLTVPQHPFLWSEFDARAHHARRYRAAELRTKVSQAGFEIIRMTSFVTLLLPFMFLSRLTQRAPEADYNPLAEFRIASWLNWSLEKVLSFERALIRSGISLPAGGSLLLVARRQES
ncbi:MAG TPA: class I SAM-dependent methyltransferase [Burkholderiales bacterium]|nr:class I SAM-dependent methyltransferase [Burkholderiales bacterium]